MRNQQEFHRSPPRRDALQIEVVDPLGNAVGSTTKAAAHERGGLLHRAVSVYLLDAHGDLVIQRRAATKYHSAGTWTNTCCGHPAPGESPESAAIRRVHDELGLRLRLGSLMPAGTILYEVDDPASGLSEREFDHLFVGRSDTRPRPNLDEVATIDSLRLEDLSSLAERPEGVSPWFWTVTNVALPALMSLRESAPWSAKPPACK